MRWLGVFVTALLVLLGCRGGAKAGVNENRDYTFRYVSPPSGLTDSARVAYMRDHFWDNFDFADSLATQRADTTEMLRAMSIYVADYVGPTNQAPIRAMMQKASASRPMFDYFVFLAKKILNNAHSNLRSDELYIAVLEAQATTPLYNKYEQMAPAYDLHMALQNRIGHIANDFQYTLNSGQTGSFHNIESEVIILYFSHPWCSMCYDLMMEMKKSPVIENAIRKGRLKVITMYVDTELKPWKDCLSEYPKQWINGYDKSGAITRERRYNTSAVPSIYVMDRDKRVLIKDSTNLKEVEQMIKSQLKARR